MIKKYLFLLPILITITVAGILISWKIHKDENIEKNQPQNSESKLKVITSFSILGDIIANVGGNFINLISIVGANEDAHIYAPKPLDSQNLFVADLVFINGLNLEVWFAKLIQASGYKGEVIEVSKGINPIILPDTYNKRIFDPHVWNEVANVIIWVDNIVKALQKKDPQHATQYADNAKEYKEKLYNLEQHIRQKILPFAHDKLIVVTSHDAFHYFERGYGINFIAPQGINTEYEPSFDDINEIIKTIKKNKIKVIFVENTSNQKFTNTISQRTGAKIGGVLYSDALSHSGGVASNYIAMMKYNLEQILISFNRQND